MQADLTESLSDYLRNDADLKETRVGVASILTSAQQQQADAVRAEEAAQGYPRESGVFASVANSLELGSGPSSSSSAGTPTWTSSNSGDGSTDWGSSNSGGGSTSW